MSVIPKTSPTSNTIQKTDLLSLTLPQLEHWLVEKGEAPFRAKQLYNWLYQHLVTDFSQMTNLPQVLRDKLAEEASIGPMIVRSELHSKDDRTRKMLLELAEPLRGATLVGQGPKLMSEIDMVGTDLGYSTGTCGKDGQGAPVADAQPTIRIPSVVVGGKLK